MAKVRQPHNWLLHGWYLLNRFVAVATVALMNRLKIYGRENVPQTGSLLVVCNHQSFFDPMLSQTWVQRPFYFVPRATLLDNPLFGRLLKSYYIVPIRLGQADIAAMKTIIEYLKQGQAVCLYPEGSRTWDGRIGQIKPGFSLMSRRSGATVLPMVIDGMFEAWPRTQKWPKPGRVGVMYGQPIPAERIKNLGDEAFAEELTRILRSMQDELRRKMGREPFTYDTE